MLTVIILLLLAILLAVLFPKFMKGVMFIVAIFCFGLLLHVSKDFSKASPYVSSTSYTSNHR